MSEAVRNPGLTVTRHVGERIIIELPDGRPVYVTLSQVKFWRKEDGSYTANRARLTIVAPDDVNIHREETYEQHRRIATPRADAAAG